MNHPLNDVFFWYLATIPSEKSSMKEDKKKITIMPKLKSWKKDDKNNAEIPSKRLKSDIKLGFTFFKTGKINIPPSL